VKPSEHPLSPFNPNYKAKIDWRPMQQLANNGAAVTRNLEKSRQKNPNHDLQTGVVIAKEIRLLPRLFHIYGKA
jgi:hypothetical protein